MTKQLHVTSWRMVGAHYSRGIRYPGFTQLVISDGSTRTYPEDVAIGPALDRVQIEYGIDTTEAKQKLNNWIKTGESVHFTLGEEPND